ncbi:MAG: GTP 3',8-cyclase MoaA [Gammaproteobacteria bacterium]|nr:GTP 3',8-cyclase MoaA [Gammaproteobacteria bacterium]MDD9869509.1 GTP 3',8-cyclase MoaA [Gammaproteobacteria bacterium]
MNAPHDQLGRTMRDLRISVTDRCNFRCTYCMPKEVFNADYRFMARAELLSFEEIARVVSLFAGLGVRKVRLTGGEPLIRHHLEVLIDKIAALGVADISLTTNGALLTADKARALKDAGLRRLTVSLDALDNEVFSRLNGVAFPVDRVLRGIDNARAAGFAPVKVNMVVRKGVNDAQVLPMARHFRNSGCILRFIEYMDVGHSNAWKMDDVAPTAQLIKAVHREFPIEPADPNYRGEVARRWRYRDGAGEIGFISSVTQPFCGDCTRIRMSADGRLYTCLFATRGHDLRRLLRERHSDEYLGNWLRDLWRSRADRYSEMRSEQTVALEKVEMSYIGG